MSIALIWSICASKTRWTSPCWFPTARSATSPPRWRHARWKPPESQLLSWAAPATSWKRSGFPDFCSTTFPLGNAAGLPHDPASQKKIAQLALELATTADAPPGQRCSRPINGLGLPIGKITIPMPICCRRKRSQDGRREFDQAQAGLATKEIRHVW